LTMTGPLVSAVVVNYLTAHLLPDCLESLYSQDLPLEIWVVDNSKSDLERKNLERLVTQRQFNLIFNQENIGYGRACNAAVSKAEGQYLLCLNTDVRMLPGSLRRMVEGIKETGAQLVGPRFYWDRGGTFLLPPSIPENWITESAWLWADSSSIVARMWSRWWARQEQAFWNAAGPFRQKMLSGACLLADRGALKTDGTLFDPAFFLYYEDAELCRRIRRGGGGVFFLPQAHAVHLYAQSPVSSSFVNSEMNRGKEIYRRGYARWQNRVLHLQKGLRSRFPRWRARDETFSDLGTLNRPPDLSWDSEGTSVVRVGINPLFVPSAGASIKGGRLKFSSDLWNQMASGPYFVEVRRARTWNRIGSWSWRKAAP
jgi:GT2 family glycosyltransferase